MNTIYRAPSIVSGLYTYALWMPVLSPVSLPEPWNPRGPNPCLTTMKREAHSFSSHWQKTRHCVRLSSQEPREEGANISGLRERSGTYGSSFVWGVSITWFCLTPLLLLTKKVRVGVLKILLQNKPRVNFSPHISPHEPWEAHITTRIPQQGLHQDLSCTLINNSDIVPAWGRKDSLVFQVQRGVPEINLKDFQCAICAKGGI